MNRILQILTENAAGNRENIRFVFPTQTAAFFWAQKVLSLLDIKALAMDRFLAWDKFKESCIRTEIKGLKAANSVHRALFSVNLAERNAKNRLFSALIPAKYSAEGAIFAQGLAKILPLLRLWHENYERFVKNPADEEDRDFLTLEEEYKNFLSAHNLFESAWERPPFKETENEYFIFYPELIEDFAEHEQLLGSPNIHIVKIDETQKVKQLYQFDSSRAELRAAILEIRRLYEEEKIPYEDMSISAPELDVLEPYIKREAALYDVPLHLRSGKALSQYGAGAFFSLVKDCVSNHFSFSSLKALLLNNHLPWRSPEKNESLIRFGIDNNCVSSYHDNSVLKDVWEEAFRMEKSELYSYYKDIKYKLYGIVNSKSFEDIRKYYFAFRGEWDDENGTSLFLRSACSAECYDITARCIEELSSLIQMQGMIPDITISDVLSFYIEQLNEKQYVPEREDGGVNVFQYKVAAAAPFAAHFVLNANQKKAAVIYRGLKFLRPDKRKKLRLLEDDHDATSAFFRAYNSGLTPKSYIWYSASSLTFSGWNMPHSFFNDNSVVFAPNTAFADAYTAEKDWWADDANQFPSRLFPVQKNGFNFWRNAPAANGFNLINMSFSGAAENGGAENGNAVEMLHSIIAIIVEKIAAKKFEEGSLRVSATDLNSFYKCAVFWLFENVFDIDEENLEARLLDDRSKGMLFHDILFNLFDRIKNEDVVFSASNIEKYKSWAEIYTIQAASEYKAFRGPLCAPLINSMIKGIQRHISELLELEAKKFNGYSILELEAEKKIEYADFILKGRLDKVSFSPEDAPCIFDYKTGKTPAKKDCVLTDNGKIADFQIPVYVKLYEETHGIPADEAVFLSIVKHEAVKILDAGGRDAYQQTMEGLESYLEDYHKKIETLDFRKKDVAFVVCAECIYKKICRTTFSLISPRTA